ncbi:MAG: DUF951 domain-containing protein [Anaerovoracaceae bacterium]|nr:DUF951 domain-containing protein [Bacillota bacterium]MDY2670770.1 DUF951 domain-containing protein [Anaerovoracaceae bacterium]
MPAVLQEGTVVELRKKHPCGGKNFEIVRLGMDIKLRCLTCGSQIRLPRNKLEKMISKVINS